ncbi:helix-turn-helix transcriptional regulator [Flavonifractor sp. An306]|uniref:helix-turn-helix domain-containing protein n=1 Tax=Flavonifractor sp. An306 TaxID=1965629 RepID=UPI000B3A82BE|nr:helix-turn-helix transcriptional regulator [Flavonifractor sp. An306]OUO38873.1 transcriptional regulator [Flavonifractor sp. An306]
MDSGYIAHRITQLRMARNISEYQMSLELGHSKSYIQSITSGKSLPSSQELFNIADYFDMSMSEFFDEGNVLSPTVQKAINAIRKLNEQDAALVLSMIQRLSLPLQKDGAECQGEAK